MKIDKPIKVKRKLPEFATIHPGSVFTYSGTDDIFMKTVERGGFNAVILQDGTPKVFAPEALIIKLECELKIYGERE